LLRSLSPSISHKRETKTKVRSLFDPYFNSIISLIICAYIDTYDLRTSYVINVLYVSDHGILIQISNQEVAVCLISSHVISVLLMAPISLVIIYLRNIGSKSMNHNTGYFISIVCD